MSSSFIRVPYRVEDPYSGVFNRARVVLCCVRIVRNRLLLGVLSPVSSVRTRLELIIFGYLSSLTLA